MLASCVFHSVLRPRRALDSDSQELCEVLAFCIGFLLAWCFLACAAAHAVVGLACRPSARILATHRAPTVCRSPYGDTNRAGDSGCVSLLIGRFCRSGCQLARRISCRRFSGRDTRDIKALEAAFATSARRGAADNRCSHRRALARPRSRLRRVAPMQAIQCAAPRSNESARRTRSATLGMANAGCGIDNLGK